MKYRHLAVQYCPYKILSIYNFSRRIHSCKISHSATRMIVRPRKREKPIMLCIKSCHFIDIIGTTCVDDLNTVNLSWKQPDIIVMRVFSERMRMDNQRTVWHKVQKLFLFLHIHYLRVGKIPTFIQAIYQKVDSHIRYFNAAKYIYTSKFLLNFWYQSKLQTVDYPCFYCTLKDILMQVYFACFIVFFADLIFNKTLCALPWKRIFYYFEKTACPYHYLIN